MKSLKKKSLIILLIVSFLMAVITPTVVNASGVRVIFETYGGGEIDDQIIEVGGKATRPTTNPSRSGKTFNGWYSDPNCTTEFDFNTSLTDNVVTIYAGYKVEAWVDKTVNESTATIICKVVPPGQTEGSCSGLPDRRLPSPDCRWHPP